MTRSIRTLAALLALAALSMFAATGCSTTEHHAELTERQRDSVIAKSVLPGAQVVGRAMAVTDQAAARAANMDSLYH